MKARDWEQEREYRWVVSKIDDGEFEVNIENALVGIAIGDCFPEGFKKKIGLYGELRPIHLAVMNWKNGVPQPDPTHWRLLTQQRECTDFGRVE